MNTFMRDMTPSVDLTREKGTGAVRRRRPLYVDQLPPWNVACPAGELVSAQAGVIDKYQQYEDLASRAGSRFPVPAATDEKTTMLEPGRAKWI